MNVQPFNANASTIRISVTTTATSTADLPDTGNVVRICNTGSNHAYVSIGLVYAAATVPTGTAARTCLTVMAGVDVTFSLPNNGSVCKISAITETGTTTLAVQVGEGA